ncbi:Glycosyl transferase, group 2 family protein [hydrothermal vent metagenome]|uniref:Glycosyl transferase, group 2 family protein n=1 Tax=hydrothermal vent metagenome TaxID=652676 RepID=A0A3B0U0R1_9ZZZZ
MSSIDLIRFVLGSTCKSDQQALFMLEQALLAEVEPLVYFAIHLNIDETIIYQRAAQWCGMAFSEIVPSKVPANPTIARIDAIAFVKTIRAKLFDRDVLFTSAGFSEILRIREQLVLQPDLGGRICLVPPRAIRVGLGDRCAPLLLDQARTRLARQWPYASAHLELGLVTRIVFTSALVAIISLAALTPLLLHPILVPFLAFVILIPALFRMIAALSSFWMDVEPDIAPLDDQDLPHYTILIPLREEAHMVAQLVSAMNRLDYPREKLDIKFVVESQSRNTLDMVAAELGNPIFELVIVPKQEPFTKPKALNYALPMARGELIVIYDAEDIPEPDQLRQAAARFFKDPGLDCLQAELVVENNSENWLSALFCAEYSGLFGLILPALSRWNMPLPLGGTSNHFRLKSLREVGGWDAFNVTEDADLGIRLSRLRYRTGTFSSRTFEEAPITYGSWLAQRTRWMKGWMQTFIVHNRHPKKFLRDIGWRNFLIFQAFVGGMIISAPLHTLFAIILMFRFFAGEALGLVPNGPWTFILLMILFVGYGASILVSTLGLKRLGLLRLAPYQILFPIYWILNSVAAFLAVYELFSRPYFWAKTKHGVTRFARGVDAQ